MVSDAAMKCFTRLCWASIALSSLWLTKAFAYESSGSMVVWHSQPVKPGQMVLLYGEGLHEVSISVRRLEDLSPESPRDSHTEQLSSLDLSGDWQKAQLIQPRRYSVKVLLPADLQPGIYALRIQRETQTQIVLVNAPMVWWTRGADTMIANPNGEFRVFGLGLGWNGIRQPLAGIPPGVERTRIVLKGPETLELVSEEADLYSLRAKLPKELPEGDYELWVHNGCGGREAWSRCPHPLTVRDQTPWPTREYNVLRLGARGDGKTDDTDAIQMVLDQAGRDGGGVVYFPSGEYRFSRTLTIPRRVMVRGESKESTLLYWVNPHFKLMRSVIHGECHFGLEDLTVWYVGAQYGINNMASSDKKSGGGNTLYNTDNRPPHWQEGDVILRNVVIRWQPYVGRPGWGQLNDRLQLYKQLNAQSLDAAGTGVAVWLCGRDIRIENSDIMAGGFPLLFSFFSDGSVVRNNTLHIGSGGLIWASRGRKCLWENNRMIGGETSRAGWSTKANPYYDQNYVRGNTVEFAQTADYEIFGSDGSSPVYYGAVQAIDGVKLTLAKPVRGWNWEPGGHMVFVLHGKGKGQARSVIDCEGTTLEIDQPWNIPLDETSVIGINHSLRQWLVVGNRFADGSSMQMYGLSHEVLFAENELERVGGSQEASLRFLGFQHVDGPEGTEPSYFCQMLGNRLGGSRLDSRRFQSGGNAIELHGGDPPKEDQRPSLMNASVLRGNQVRSGPIQITTNSGATTTRAEDIVIEDNQISDSPEGITVGAMTAGVSLRNNLMKSVRVPLAGRGIPDIWLEDRERLEYYFDAVDGLLKRLSVTPPDRLFTSRKEAIRRLGQPGSESFLTTLKRGLAEEVLQQLKPPHHPEIARVMLGVSVESSGHGTLHSILDAGSGGMGTLALNVIHEGELPVRCRVEPEWPKDWAGMPATTTAPPGSSHPVTLIVNVPKDCKGTYTLPAKITLEVGQAEMSWDIALTVGSGIIGDWLVIGPERKGPHRNRVWSFDEIATSPKPEFASNRLSQWDFEKPERIGNEMFHWKPVADARPLDFTKHLVMPMNLAKDEVVCAYAVTVVDASDDLWIEWTATYQGPGNSHELQFYLDGAELPDLRLGRESWSPKRLPMKIAKGRHTMLVSAQDKKTPPNVLLSIRELGTPSGGRITISTN
jgi:hypothetical protein